MRSRITKAVIPAAGLGTQFLPATKALPKEMLPIVDKPLIQYAIEELVACGIRDVCIVTGRGKTAIEEHFDVSFELEQMLRARGKSDQIFSVRAISEMADLAYIRQHEALGLGHAILRARSYVGNESFVVALADDLLCSPVSCLQQLLDVYDHFGETVLALIEVSPESAPAYGVVKAKPVPYPARRVYQIEGLVEKPRPDAAPSNLAIIGRYVLKGEIFEALKDLPPGESSEIELTDALQRILKSRPIYGVLFEGKRYDAGDKLGFLKATVELALMRQDLGPEFREYLKAVQARLVDPPPHPPRPDAKLSS